MTLKEMREDMSFVPPDFHEALIVAAHRVKEEPLMKKKTVGSILIVVFVLVLLAATAFAAYTLMRSEQTDAISQARRALLKDYGLTAETLGLFMPVTDQDEESWIITFHAFGFYPPLLGDYTVTLSPKTEPETRWTHDNVDVALWQNGELTAPVWGQQQLMKALQDKEAAEAITRPLFAQKQVPPSYLGPEMPDDLAEGEGIWNGQRVKLSTPTDEAISMDAAYALARQVAADETGFPIEFLVAPPDMITFRTRETGNPIWQIPFTVIENGVEHSCGVTLDAYTGEILSVFLITYTGLEG